MDKRENRDDVRSLLEQVGRLPEEQRSAFLQSVCADARTGQEVLELLRVDQESTRVGVQSDPGDEAASLSDDLEGHQVGRFTVIRRIGTGGMGTVYLAERHDEGLVQQAALKIVQSGVFSQLSRELFLRERRILASLDHPGICPLIDSGVTADQRPWFAMPFLEDAQPITTYCETHGLNERDRVRLFLEVCRAVHHAHQNLVVHSDIKPANVLVTSAGQVQLLDFGIARLLQTDQNDPTLFYDGKRPMTLDYASPEQLTGQSSTTQSDVYSLGALLYRLLAGDKPWRLDPARDLTTQITDRPFPPKRGVRGRLQDDLYNIALKAMAVSPDERYGSAQALANDIDCWLSRRPVSARSPSWSYLMTRFMQRHRWPVALAASLSLAGVVVIAIVLVNANRISLQAEQIARERDRAESTAEFWAQLFDQTDPVRALSPVSGLDELLDRAVEQLEQDVSMSPSVRASLLGVVSTANWNLVRPEPARGAAELATHLLDEQTEPRTRAMVWKQLANIAFAQTDLAQARAAADQALLALAEIPSPDPLTESVILDAHALILDAEGRTVEATEVLERVVELQRDISADQRYSNKATALGNLAHMYFNLARASVEPEQNFERAQDTLQQAIDQTRDQFGDDHPRLVNMYNGAGTIAMTLGQTERALGHYNAAEAIALQSLPPGHEVLAYLHYNQGLLHWRMGQMTESVRATDKALSATRISLPQDHDHLADCLVGLARAHLALGESEQAVRALEELEAVLPDLAENRSTFLWHEWLSVQLDRESLAVEELADLHERIEQSTDVDLQRAHLQLAEN